MGGAVSITDLRAKRALPFVFRECNLFSLDVNDFGIRVYFITRGDDVDFISSGCLEDRLWRCVRVYGDEGAEQAIRFFGAWRSPTQRTE